MEAMKRRNPRSRNGISMHRRLCLAFVLLILAGPAAAAAPDGRELYLRHCAACHGENGYGGVGVPLALPDFQHTATDEYFIRTIRHGRPGRVMPSFTRLSDEEVRAIVEHVRSWHEGPRPAHDPAPVKGDEKRGARLYREHCAGCHGDHGQGGHGTGVTFSRPRELPIIAPALNNRGFLAAATDQMIKQTLMRGRKGTPMVSFLEQGLTEKDIDDIVAFVRGFARNPLPHKEVPADEPPLLTAETDRPFDEVVEAVKRAAVGANFRLIRVQPLDQGLAPPGQEDQRRIIVYFCNFNFLYRAMAIDPRVGMFLPCRVTVVEDGDKVRLLAINPTRLSRLFNNSELDRACAEMAEIYANILDEATL